MNEPIQIINNKKLSMSEIEKLTEILKKSISEFDREKIRLNRILRDFDQTIREEAA